MEDVNRIERMNRGFILDPVHRIQKPFQKQKRKISVPEEMFIGNRL